MGTGAILVMAGGALPALPVTAVVLGTMAAGTALRKSTRDANDGRNPEDIIKGWFTRDVPNFADTTKPKGGSPYKVPKDFEYNALVTNPLIGFKTGGKSSVDIIKNIDPVSKLLSGVKISQPKRDVQGKSAWDRMIERNFARKKAAGAA